MSPDYDTRAPENNRSLTSRLFEKSVAAIGQAETFSAVSETYETKVRGLLHRLRDALQLALGERDELRAEVEQLRERLAQTEAAVRQLQRSPEHAAHGSVPVRKVGVRRPSTIGLVR